ncbi:MAG: N-methyl-L-tryptophan oxidase [Verrucomicrobiae bacterium]|nr:N-methyl-L-tryptophan oxidase [Verrucomicrobiae bacterium]
MPGKARSVSASAGPPADVLVLGLGGMGSATAWELTRRGARVVGLDQHGPLNDRGSSHGRTRVIRQAYFEHPSYVPLLRRAYELWHHTAAAAECGLLTLCGGLMMGPPGCEVVAGSLRSAREHGLPHEVLDASEVRRRYPPIQLPADHLALFETQAGVVHAERALQAHLDLAMALGARLEFREPVLDWGVDGEGVQVRTARQTWRAARLVITPGPWAPAVLPGLGVELRVERQVLYWIQPKDGVDAYRPGRFPIHVWEPGGRLIPYGFPALDGPDGGVKVALHQTPEPEWCTPENVNRSIRASDVARMRHTIRTLLPGLDGPLVHAVTCLYTHTPDGHFLIGLHPEYGDRVALAAGFSGHGFKFCSVVGEILADLALTGRTDHDLSLFALDRFAAGRVPAKPEPPGSESGSRKN